MSDVVQFNPDRGLERTLAAIRSRQALLNQPAETLADWRAQRRSLDMAADDRMVLLRIIDSLRKDQFK